MSSLNLSILTPEGPIYQGTASGLVAPGVAGSFGVLPGHATMLSALETGIVKVTRDGKNEFYVLDNGFLEVRDGDVMILAGHVDKAKDRDDAKGLLKLAIRGDIESAD